MQDNNEQKAPSAGTEQPRKKQAEQSKTSHSSRGKLDTRERFQYKEEEAIVKDFDWSQFKRLLGYTVPYKGMVAIALVLMLLAAGSMLIGPYLTKLAIDTAIEPGNLQQLNFIAVAYLSIYILNFIATSFRIKLTARVGQNILYDMRKKLFSHIQDLSFRFYDSRPAGKIMVRLTSDIESLNNLLSNGIVNVLSDIFLLIGILTIMMSMHFKLTLASMITLPFLVILSTRLRFLVRMGWRRVRRKVSTINAHLNESISGIRVTQSFTQEENNKEFFDGINEDYRSTFMSTIRLNAMFGPLVEITGALGTTIVIWYGTNLLIDGVLTVGSLVAFVSYLGRFWEPISRMGDFYNQLLVAMASSERIFDYLDTEPDVTDSPNAWQLPSIDGRVTFDDVYFAYEKDRYVLQDINLDVAPGETIALVGHTGAGKTSIINLICRFYDPSKGRVLIDGHDLSQVTLPSLRSQIGMVLQETFLFSGTIADNIRYGNLAASEDDIIAAAKAVNAHDFIMQLGDGYDTEVQERGTRLSVGQRQLLSFARALIGNPRILILDEATSSIDTQTEILIQDALKRLLKGRTSFVVAHRLSTIRNADRIVVLEDGLIKEVGTHQQLFDDQGIYYNLLRAQFKFLEEVS